MKTLLLMLTLATGAAVPVDASEWKTAEVKHPYLSGRNLYAYVEGEDAWLALSCQIEPCVPDTFTDLTVRIGRTDYLGEEDRRATLNLRFGDEKMEFALPGFYADQGAVKEASGWGEDLVSVVRRLQSSDDDDVVAVRVVLGSGQVLRTVKFPLTGAKEAVSSMSGCGGQSTLIWLIAGGILYTVVLVLLAEYLVRHAGRSSVTGRPLQTEKVNGTRKLLRDFEVTFEREKIIVPKCFVSDYSSIPWFGRWLVRWSTVDVAGVVHDYLYRKQMDRKEADRIWRKIAGSGSVYASFFQRWICWLALRVGGWVAYRKYRQRTDS